MSSSCSWLGGCVIVAMTACGGQVASIDGGATSDAGGTSDASDGSICVDIDAAAFDTTCNGDPDCIAIAAGTFCTGYNCSCPSATINASSQAAYQALIGSVPHGPTVCSCPLLGSPRCIGAQCVFCPNPATKPSTFPPGCPTSECAAAGGTCKPVSQNQCMGGGASMGQLDCQSGEGCCK